MVSTHKREMEREHMMSHTKHIQMALYISFQNLVESVKAFGVWEGQTCISLVIFTTNLERQALELKTTIVNPF